MPISDRAGGVGSGRGPRELLGKIRRRVSFRNNKESQRCTDGQEPETGGRESTTNKLPEPRPVDNKRGRAGEEESAVTRTQHRATMDELTATFDRSLRNLSTVLEERLARVDDRLGGHERRLQLVERQMTTIEESAANLVSDVKAQIETMQMQIKEQGCIIVHTQDLVNSLLQEAEYTEVRRRSRKETTPYHWGERWKECVNGAS